MNNSDDDVDGLHEIGGGVSGSAGVAGDGRVAAGVVQAARRHHGPPVARPQGAMRQEAQGEEQRAIQNRKSREHDSS